MKPPNSVKAIIFDMDGVLIDAKDWHYDSLNKALDLFGLEISRYDHLVTYDGLPTKKKLEMLTLERGVPRSLHGLINELKQDYLMEIAYQKCKPLFCHQFALAKLREKSLKMAVCSNSIRRTVDIFLEKAKITQYFDFTLSNEDVCEPKPSPEIYLKAIKSLRLNPNECLIIEDNENGVKAAKDSGAHVLVVNKTQDVNIENILRCINEIEGGSK